jgi:hypothetical protein
MDKFRCLVCDKEERECRCDQKEYCCLCQGGEDVRLCLDGNYYCTTCREACDFEAQY